MTTLTFLLDKSAWVQAQYSTAVAARLADLIRSGGLAVCTVTALEVLYCARNAQEYGGDHARLRTCRGSTCQILERRSDCNRCS